jgi:hypothetical protein
VRDALTLWTNLKGFAAMPVDHIRYDLLTQQALRAVVRRVLADVAKTGSLPGEHHFYVTFDTRAAGVKLSARMREQYPEEMTIVLQHQFWDLAVTDTHFEVALSFNGVSEKLSVPLEAIKGFFDPSVQFGLQFETLTDAKDDASAEKTAPTPVAEEPRAGRTRRKPVVAAVEPEAPAAVGPAEPAREKPKAPAPVLVGGTDNPEPDKPSGGAEVVRLDRFRKK